MLKIHKAFLGKLILAEWSTDLEESTDYADYTDKTLNQLSRQRSLALLLL
jgi:hypothetical protein